MERSLLGMEGAPGRQGWPSSGDHALVPGRSTVVIEVSAASRAEHVVVCPGRDHLVVRSTGYRPLRHLAEVYAGGHGADQEGAIRHLLDRLVEASGLSSEKLQGCRDIRIPVQREASVALLVAVAVQKAAARLAPFGAGEPLDYSTITIRQGRHSETYLVEIQRWCTRSTSAFRVRKLLSAPNRQWYEVRF